ncbi:MAG: hydroxymethylglutaryl-CoA reductase, degradative, partial [Thermoplasmata archaeon]|nr:hydroxymethylglutaryl-CoA reductase, degradative [Thermoplasmata archaeon]
LIPMALEEPSVVAAASNSAKVARVKGGFHASSDDPVMIGQIQLTGVADPFAAKIRIMERRAEILELANRQDPVLVKFGGGARDIEVRVIDTPVGSMVITHLLVDVRDAMGANAVNTMAEAVAPFLEEMTGGRVYLRILSNLADHRIVRVWAVFDAESLGGEEVVDGIIQAWAFAAGDPYRAATHNKGIMNGASAVVRATGNDTRAVEAGAHAYAARNGRYAPLTWYEKNADNDLVGSIEMPMPVGLVGGATKTHPVAKACVKILGVKTAGELAMVIAATGLAQNHAALRALATEGIQRGHMGLHARNTVAMAAETLGVRPDPAIVDEVSAALVRERKVRVDRAEELLKKRLGL